jgi:hypothetical protein
MPGSNEEFDILLKEYHKNVRSYDARAINHVSFATAIDGLFATYRWSKKEFFLELNRRLGISHNEKRKSKAVEASKKKSPKRAAKKKIDLPF